MKYDSALRNFYFSTILLSVMSFKCNKFIFSKKIRIGIEHESRYKRRTRASKENA